MKKYYYRIYGLNVLSEIHFPNLFISNTKSIDVTIICCKLIETIQKKMENEVLDEITENYMWFHIRDVATFLIEEGSIIKVSRFIELYLF